MTTEEFPKQLPHYQYKRASHESLAEKAKDLRPFIAAASVVTAFVLPLVLKYIPNNFNSESVKPPTTTEQVVDNNNQNNPPELKIAK